MWNGMVYGLEWYDVVWHGMAQYDMIWSVAWRVVYGDTKQPISYH